MRKLQGNANKIKPNITNISRNLFDEPLFPKIKTNSIDPKQLTSSFLEDIHALNLYNELIRH